MGPTVLFQLTFTFIYSKKILVSVKQADLKQRRIVSSIATWDLGSFVKKKKKKNINKNDTTSKKRYIIM